MTVGELVTVLSQRLAAREGLPDPRREVRWLLARRLGHSEAWLLANPELEADTDDAAVVANWVARRAAGEPAHYIVGTCEFFGREFVVTPAVLIPRPETELIVARALSPRFPADLRALDIATGSGCLATTLALELPHASVAAVDLSLTALAVARHNAARLGARVAFAAGDLATHVDERFDLVVANLPYVPSAELERACPEVRDHEPRLALDGGADGLDVVRRLLPDLAHLLAPEGVALLELGTGQAETVVNDAARYGLCATAWVRDVAGAARVVELRRS
jgi:release factor glutamine methyltransferase